MAVGLRGGWPLAALFLSTAILGRGVEGNNEVVIKPYLKFGWEMNTTEGFRPSVAPSNEPTAKPDNPWFKITVTWSQYDYWSLGFDAKAVTMYDLDNVLGWIEPNGECKIVDLWSYGKETPEVDSVWSKDCKDQAYVESCAKADGVNTMVWWRLANTGDPESCDAVFRDEVQGLTWAVGAMEGQHYDEHPHGGEGYGLALVEVNWFTGKQKVLREGIPMMMAGCFLLLIFPLLCCAGWIRWRWAKLGPYSGCLSCLHRPLVGPCRCLQGFFRTWSEIGWVEVLCFTILNLITLAFIVFGANSHPADFNLAAWGRGFGHAATWAFAASLATPTKYSIWLMVFKIPQDRLMKVHRFLGRMFGLTCALHFLFEVLNDDFAMAWRFYRGQYHVQPLPGTIAFILCLIIGVSSMNFFRRKFWDQWHTIHVGATILCVIATLIHLIGSKFGLAQFIIMVGGAFALFVLDKILRIAQNKLLGSTLESHSVEGGAEKYSVMRIKTRISWEAGQYVWLNIKAKGEVPGQLHCITIGSSPLEPDCLVPQDPPNSFILKVREKFPRFGEQRTMLLWIKANSEGSWSDKLARYLEKVEDSRSVPIGVFGPFGASRIPHHGYPHCLFICGGIGCTPMIAHYRDTYLRNLPDLQSATIVWSMREGLAGTDEAKRQMGLLAQTTQDARFRARVYSSSMTSSNAVLSIPALPANPKGRWGQTVEIQQPQSCAEVTLRPEGSFNHDEYFAPPSSPDGGGAWAGAPAPPVPTSPEDQHSGSAPPPAPPLSVQQGRPDIEAILAEIASGSAGAPIGVYVCGPDALVARVQKAVRESRSKTQIDLHTETFEL